jgi:1,4-dihydroxy-2-naphthoate octaprenyltransferase
MASPAEPTADTFAGNNLSQVARRYWYSMRPAFFPASVMPVVVGTAWGQAAAGHLDLTPALLALAATALVHGGANVINDVGDELGGTDRANVDRIFPYTGGSRSIQNGILSLVQMRRFGWALLAVATLLGILLAVLKGATIVWLGLAGIALAVAYSLRPLQLAARGIGEIAIGIGFGVLPVMGAAWLQSGVFDTAALLVAVPTAVWVTAILLINEVPDLRADAGAGKRTLPVRIGIDGTRAVYIALHAGALLAAIALVLRGELHWLVLTGSAALFAMALAAARGIREPTDATRDALRGSIEKTLAMHALGSLWIAGWAWFALR